MTTSYSKSISTPGPQASFQPDSRQIAPQSGRIRNDSDRAKKRKLITITSQSLLNFDNFIHTDMSLFHVKVISVEKHVFSPEAYVVEIRISSIPPFKVQKVCEEFRTFHRALTLRFPNVNWPEFPSSFLIITGKKSETRMKAFNEMLTRICEVARLEDGSKRSILSIFYAFFLESGIYAGSEEHPGDKKKSTAATPDHKTRGHAESFTSCDSGKKENRFEVESNESEKGSVLKHAFTFSAGKKLSEDSGKPELARGSKSISYEPKKNKTVLSFSTDHEFPCELNAKESFEGPEPDVKKVMSLAHIEGDTRIWKRSKSCDDCKSIMDMEMFTNLMGNPFIDKNTQEFALKTNRSEENKLTKATSHHNEIQKVKKLRRRNSETLKRRDNHDNLIAMKESSIIEKNQLKRPNLRPKGRTVVESTKEEPVAEKVVKFKENDGVEGKVAARKLSREEIQRKPIEKSVSLKDKEEEKIEALENSLIKKRSRELSLNDDITAVKEIVGFNGAIHAKLSTELTWNKYFARISDCSLHLYQSILDHFPVHVVPCYHSVVNYVDLATEEYIEVFHFYDADKMQICIDPASEDQNTDTAINSARNLATWYTQLKIASQKVTGLQISEENYQPIGKLQLIITSASNVKGLPKNSTCFVRISHTPYVLQTGKSLMGETMKWKQSFFVPICDTFFPITLELVCAYNNGWVKESLTEEVICTSEIVVPDVLSLRSNTILTMNLPFKYSESKRKQILKSCGLQDQDLHDPIMRIKVKNLSTMKTYFAPQYSDFVEGVKMDSQKFVRQLFKLSISRIKRVVSYFILLKREFNAIYQFKYPVFSSLCFIFFTWLIMTLEVSNLLAEFLLALAILCVYKHPEVEAKVKPFLTRMFFKEQDLNPFYKPCLVNTQGDLTIKKNMRTAHWKFKLKTEDTLMTQLQLAKKSIIIITIILTKISGFCEKLKNLVLWDDPYRSAWFMLMTTIGYCIVSVVPIRIAILFGIWAKFIRGVDHYRSLYPKNREVAIHTLSFILSKNFPEHKKFIMENLALPWPATLSLNNFQKRLIEHIKARIEIVLLPEDFANIRTPEDLISRLETCHKALKFKRDALEEASLHIFKPEEPKFKPLSILHFIMNVPSDYYRVIHPKMNIRQKHITH